MRDEVGCMIVQWEACRQGEKKILTHNLKKPISPQMYYLNYMQNKYPATRERAGHENTTARNNTENPHPGGVKYIVTPSGVYYS